MLLRAGKSTATSACFSMFKNVLASVGPCLVSIINSSLNSGFVKAHFKHAILQPSLKKTNPDPSLLKNYRPISISFNLKD